MDTLDLLINLLIYLPFIILLIYLSSKLGSKGINRLQRTSYIRVLEKVQLSKESSLMLIKLGEKGYVMGISNNSITTLEELSKEEIVRLEEEKKQASEKSVKDVKALIDKINIKGRNHHEKIQ